MANEIIKSESLRVVAVPHPFKTTSIDISIPAGMSLSGILESVQPDIILRRYAHIFVNDGLVCKEHWGFVCPNKGDIVTIRVIPMDGGGGKNPLRTLMTIAVIAASFAFPALLGLTAGTFAFAAVQLGTLAVGMLALNALVPPSVPSLGTLSGTGDKRESPTLFIEGARNTARPFGTVPVVLGVHKNVPPLGTKMYTEIVGNDQHLRMLVIWGYGALKIEDVKVGDTPIEDFDDVRIETREGRVGDAAITLYTDQVNQDDFAILLKQVDSWNQRTTQIDTDEISIDFVFARGLVKFSKDDGSRKRRSAVVEIEYREVGDVTWLTPTYTAKSVPDSWVSGSAITFTAAKTSAQRYGFRWSVSSRGQYEVRARRTTSDSTSKRIFDEVTWSTLRSITDEDPINFPHPLAVTAITVKATNQLNSVIDDLNAKVSSYVLDWNGSTWAEAVSSNPASLFRHVLQSDAIQNPLADGRIDLTQLEAFHDYCVTNSFEFNMIRDFQSSVWEALADVARAGRASPSQVDGKWSVVVDEQQIVPVQHFTSRNSWNFEAEKTFINIPHGLRMRFANRDKEWRQDEIIVYDDGFTEANATEFEQLDVLGITDSDHIWKIGRYSLAQIRLRPERWTLDVDFEHIVAKRGNMVLITHDVLLVGLASGRIKAIQVDGGGNATGITVDEVLVMEPGKDYGVSIRTVGDVELTKDVVLDIGDQTTIVFTSTIPVADVPIVGDLFGFGELGSETIEGLLLSIEPQSELTARLTIIPNSSPAVYNADTGTIPDFDSKLTPPTESRLWHKVLPEVHILNVRTDESVLKLGAGDTLIPRIAIEFVPAPIDSIHTAKIRARIRLTGSNALYDPATISIQTANEIIIEDVEHLQTYDVRLHWSDRELFLSSPPTVVSNIYVIGQTDPPDPLINLTISAFGGTALLRWDMPWELDVRFGGTVRFRHSHELVASNASWSQSVSIGTVSQSSDLTAQLPLKPGTYLARVFDKGGRPSTVVKISTKQASLLTFADVSEVIEQTAFSGTHTNTIAIDNVLKLTATGLFDDIPDLDLVLDFIDGYGGISSSGTYDFAAGFDFGSVEKVRLTTDLNVLISNVLDQIDSRTADIDDWEDFDATEQAEADARVQERHTDDDPASSPSTWSVWNDLDSAEFIARGFDFRLNLSTVDPAFNPVISKLQVKAEEIT